MQDVYFSCRCAATCISAYASMCSMCLPRASSHVQTDVLCLSRVAEVSPLHLPLIFSSLLSPFHEHLFSRAGWVTPVSQWRRAGMRSPYKPVTITAGVATELGGPLSARRHQSGREVEFRMQGDIVL